MGSNLRLATNNLLGFCLHVIPVFLFVVFSFLLLFRDRVGEWFHHQSTTHRCVWLVCHCK